MGTKSGGEKPGMGRCFATSRGGKNWDQQGVMMITNPSRQKKGSAREPEDRCEHHKRGYPASPSDIEPFLPEEMH